MSKKKRVTFSICTDKNELSPAVSIHKQNEEPKRLLDTLKNSDSSEFNKPSTAASLKVCSFTEPVHCIRKSDAILPIHTTGKSDVKKTLVRNVEQTVSSRSSFMKVMQCPSKCSDIPVIERPRTNQKPVYKNKYAAPELYTTLCIAKDIQATESSLGKQSSSLNISSAKQMLDEKILCKLNFPFEEKLYKDLVSLAVCEEDLHASNDRQREVKFRHVKDQEPQIADFYAPLPGKEYKVVQEPEPRRMERIRRYDGFSLYKRSQTWSSH